MFLISNPVSGQKFSKSVLFLIRKKLFSNLNAGQKFSKTGLFIIRKTLNRI